MNASDFAASGIADWWDKQKSDSDKILSDWVQDNPQWWVIAVATATSTAMDLGAPMVDVLRFGEGMAEGGWKGLGQDTLRALALLGPLGKLGDVGGALSRFVKPLLASGRLRLAVQVAGVDGPCTFQAVNDALSITKRSNLFIRVADMAAAVGKQVSQLTELSPGKYELGAWMDELVPFLRQTGIRIKEVTGFTSLAEVDNLARQESGVVVFAIKTTVRNAKGEIEEILHSVIAMRSALGRVRYADYGGEFVGSLRELVSKWGTPASEIELFQSGISAAVIEHAELTGEIAMKLAKGTVVVLQGLAAIETHENGVELAVPVAVGASTAPARDDPAPPEVVKAAFEAYKARATGKKIIRLPEVVITAGRRTAPRSDWLTGVQYRLNAAGFGCGRVDGIMGPLTRKAVIAFQRAYPPLAADGVPGPRTQAKLVEVCGY